MALGLFRGREKSSERDVTGLPRSGEAAAGGSRLSSAEPAGADGSALRREETYLG